MKTNPLVYCLLCLGVLAVFPTSSVQAELDTKTRRHGDAETQSSISEQRSAISSSAIPRIRDLQRPATTLKEWERNLGIQNSQLITQNSVVEVTGVRLNQTEIGLEIVLETQDGQPLQIDATKFRTENNNLIADIRNAVLALTDAQEFNAENPTVEIANVRVVQVDATSIRVSVAGKNALPTGGVTLRTGDLSYSLNPDGELPEEEVVVTGEGNQYFAPNASTATRTDTPILDTPQSIQVIPQQVLQDQQILRVDDALRNVSGVVGRLSPFGFSESLTLRGFTTDSFSNGPILRDGFRVYYSLGVQETGNLERIEVLKGPASVLYGQNDPGGLINLVTKQPLSNPFANFELQLGSFGLVR